LQNFYINVIYENLNNLLLGHKMWYPNSETNFGVIWLGFSLNIIWLYSDYFRMTYTILNAIFWGFKINVVYTYFNHILFLNKRWYSVTTFGASLWIWFEFNQINFEGLILFWTPYFEVLKQILKHLNFIFGNKICLFWNHQTLGIGYKNMLPNFQKDSPITYLVH
jgi:hypothetical protein